jgi:hypothetical protein
VRLVRCSRRAFISARRRREKLIAVVDAYTRDQALALGLEKSFAVTR